MAGNDGVDLIVEVGGQETLPQSLRAIRAGGRISLIGV
jgi:NADPH:quinone reductase-like Zn-dependent oxidoreductase